MPVQQIVYEDEISQVIENAIEQIRSGVRANRAGGIVARLPESVVFDLLVIRPEGWQKLENLTTQTSEGGETQGGSNKETAITKGAESSNQSTVGESKKTSKDSQKTDTEGRTDSSEDQVTNSEENSSGSETRTGSETSTSTETTSESTTSGRASSEFQVGTNEHIQNDVTNYEYEDEG